MRVQYHRMYVVLSVRVWTANSQGLTSFRLLRSVSEMTISRCQRNPDNVDDAMRIGERDWRCMWNSKLLLRLACLLACLLLVLGRPLT